MVSPSGRMCMSGAMYASMNGPPPGESPGRARHLLHQERRAPARGASSTVATNVGYCSSPTCSPISSDAAASNGAVGGRSR